MSHQPYMAASYGPEPVAPHVVALLLGARHSGKSSAGNTILGRRAFRQNTTRSSRQVGAVQRMQVAVVDTPGWPSHSATPHTVSKELCRGLALCQPGPHVILLVVPATAPFGREEWGAMQAQLRLLQTPIWQRAMVLFTHGDQLGSFSIQEHIRQQGRSLQWLLQRCGNRYQVMTSQSVNPEAQVAQLFEKIHELMEAQRRPVEVQQRLYTQLRQEVCMELETGWHSQREKIEMTAVCDTTDGRGPMRQVSSGWSHTPTGPPSAPAVSEPALSLILLGRRRSGKSSAGNMILDRLEFRINSWTSRCSVGRGAVSGRSVTVVDTPGWSLFGLASPKRVKAEIGRSPSLCHAPSKVAFLLALPVDSFREKDRRAVETYVGVLGEAAWRSTVVMFTYADQLRGRTVEELVEETGQPLRRVMERCGGRHCLLDSNAGDEAQVSRLLQIVEQL